MLSFFKKVEKVEKVEEKQLSLKEKISKYNYLELKHMFNVYMHAAYGIRHAMNSNKGAIKYSLRLLKKEQGQRARIHAVAIAFLKGKKYSQAEPNCENKITRGELLNVLNWAVDRKYRKYLESDLELFLAEEMEVKNEN